MSPESTTLPDWHVTIPNRYTPPPSVQPPALRLPEDIVILVVVAVFVTLVGSAAGLVWSAVAPKLSLAKVAVGADAAFKSELGADMGFAAVLLVTGALCGLVVVLAGARGPGAIGGLGIGGMLGSLVAARVGYLADRDRTLHVLHHFGVTVKQFRNAGIDPFFQLHATGLLVAWPLASLLVAAVVIAVTGRDD
ncbi:MAG: hypothetical protein JO222_05565 [Frankiales bacterium]|nr:hypothetical protein [Frankiales bacterium]